MSDTTGPLGYSTDPAVRARQLHAEGRFGGPQPGSGRPRVARASEVAADAAVQHGEAIVAALLAGVTEGTGEARARTAARWVALAQRRDDHDLRERREAREDVFTVMSADEIYERGADMLLRMVRDGAIDLAQIQALPPAERVADAVVVDDD